MTAHCAAELQSPDSSHSARLQSSVRDGHLGVRITGPTLSNKTPGYAKASSSGVSLRQAINTGAVTCTVIPTNLPRLFPAPVCHIASVAQPCSDQAFPCSLLSTVEDLGYMPSVRLPEPEPRIPATHGHPRELLLVSAVANVIIVDHILKETIYHGKTLSTS
ncbi:hypothetical protein BDP55DRAFT_633396 [Colletotrichum godetiae]|uniref:Uncharacterized protein n=1 Tax=Colletotrichum godetiae TaxID=1209918 RepID=A0AAJ0ESS0_9PEZI|nr:uncharacterized protein BDP55DRAFT_633396 [Colletotrichum godetiae]KAK1674197.1 hypothetical protein BDP55DRAFT_633396 [Colletotrichum godetiae]